MNLRKLSAKHDSVSIYLRLSSIISRTKDILPTLLFISGHRTTANSDHDRFTAVVAGNLIQHSRKHDFTNKHMTKRITFTATTWAQSRPAVGNRCSKQWSPIHVVTRNHQRLVTEWQRNCDWWRNKLLELHQSSSSEMEFREGHSHLVLLGYRTDPNRGCLRCGGVELNKEGALDRNFRSKWRQRIS